MSGTIHASAVIVGEHGILIRGASGSGKSGLALALLRAAAQSGMFGRLVGDDRIALIEANGRLILRGHPAIAGRVERRYFGIDHMPHEPACVARLVVEWQSDDVAARLPEAFGTLRKIGHIALPHLPLPARLPRDAAVDAILAWLHREISSGNRLAATA